MSQTNSSTLRRQVALAAVYLGSAVLVCLAQAPARAVVPGLTLAGDQSTESNGPWTMGFLFATSRPILIDALGVFDSGAPGLVGSYHVGIWNSDGLLLASTAVSGLGDSMATSFVWKDLPTHLALLPDDYVVAATGDYTGGDAYAFLGTYATLAGITYVENRFASGSDFQFPYASTDRTNPGWFGANFSTAVPGPLPALGVASALAWSRRLKRRMARATPSAGSARGMP